MKNYFSPFQYMEVFILCRAKNNDTQLWSSKVLTIWIIASVVCPALIVTVCETSQTPFSTAPPLFIHKTLL